MKPLFLFFWFCLLIVWPTLAQDTTQEDIPYIYYYSTPLNGIVIERADGSDSRIIGQGLVDEEIVGQVYGPGWSPDGRWFAWRVWTPDGYYGRPGKGYVISTDNQTTIEILDYFACVSSMLWHPTRNILLVYGSTVPSGRHNEDFCTRSHAINTIWLIDVETQQRLATYSIDMTYLDNSEIDLTQPIYWLENGLRFPQATIVNYQSDFEVRGLLVSMYFDGTVDISPMPLEEVYKLYDGLYLYGVEGDRQAYRDNERTEFTDFEHSHPLTPFRHSNSALDTFFSEQQDESGSWILVSYGAYSLSSQQNMVSVYYPKTGLYREVANCGIHPTCIGWLPEQVDTDDLPLGQPISVLSAPQTLDHTRMFQQTETQNSYLLDTYATHDVICQDALESDYPGYDRLNGVQNRTTGQIDFVLREGHVCQEPSSNDDSIRIIYQPFPVVFTLSPDNRYYAMTDDTNYTSLYDAETQERIAKLNFNGLALHFSDDSRTLITTGRNAEATWDIETLIAESLIYPIEDAP